MTFKSIGTLAGSVLEKAERTAKRRALRFDAVPLDSREDEAGEPRALRREGAPSAMGMGKDRRPKPPASQQGGVKQREEPLCKVQKLDTPSTMLGSMVTATAAPERKPPSSAVIIDLNMVRKLRHARSLSRTGALDLSPRL